MTTVNEWQLRKAAIKVTNLMIWLMYEHGPYKLTFNPKLPVTEIPQRCGNYFTCMCPPHLCIYSFARFHRATFNSISRTLKQITLPACFTTTLYPQTLLLNPLFDALIFELHTADYIQKCLQNLHFQVILDEKAESVTYFLGIEPVQTFQICTTLCNCCSTVVR